MNTPSPVRLALLNIGQAPRHDLTEAIEQGLPPHVQAWHVGALDGLTRAEVQSRFAPAGGAPCLISRLSDGATVTLDATLIGQQLQRIIDRLEEDGVEVIVLLCTGEFPQLRTRGAWLVEPDAVVCRTVTGLLGDNRAGVILPLPQQEEEARAKWCTSGAPPLFAAASPYAPDSGSLVEAARTLQAQGAHALVLDCMGYAPHHKKALRDAGLNLPVLVSGSVLAGALGAFL
ncbi:MAG: AroM family protein [Proteobacteria bacterium]|nr:AroM family protein [Pseudomonadota bacterium]